MGTGDDTEGEVPTVDKSTIGAEDSKLGDMIVDGQDLADPVENVMGFAYSQIEATMYRLAQISTGISWSTYLSKYEAGILASHTVSAFLVHMHVPNIDKTRKLVQKVVSEGLDHFYKRTGTPRDKPIGTLEIKFVHPESTGNIVEINRKA